jgi:hypothetical protein
MHIVHASPSHGSAPFKSPAPSLHSLCDFLPTLALIYLLFFHILLSYRRQYLPLVSSFATLVMADPLSIIGGTATAIHSIDRAIKFVNGISGAPRAIATLDGDLKAISQLLVQVNPFVYQIHAIDSSAQDSFIPHLQVALTNCGLVALDVETLLRPYVKPTTDPARSTWRRLRWTVNEKKTAGLEKDMVACKQTLNMAISLAGLYVVS